MITCKFCRRDSKLNYGGYCCSCYQYFVMYGYETWCPSEYGQMNYVEAKHSPQYHWPICHICGKAYRKLQQHVYYAHGLSRIEYCDKFGLDHSCRMTSDEYNKHMSKLAYENNMHISLPKSGVKTQYKSGEVPKYKRSYQTKQRLRRFNRDGRIGKTNAGM